MITAIFNHKGGCAKTTTTVNLGASLAREGFKVLIIDLDAQANCTTYLGFDYKDGDPCIYHVLFEGLDPREAILKTKYDNLDCIVSSALMKNASTRLNQDQLSNPSTKLFISIKKSQLIAEYDIVLLDCPSDLDLVTANALNVADDCIVPCLPDLFSQEGLVNVIQALETVSQNGCGTEIKLDGAVLCNYRVSTKIAKAEGKEIFDALPQNTYAQIIRQSVAIPESLNAKIPVVTYRSNHPVSEDYIALAQEYILRHGL